jgi:DNA-binding MarR family transcriptional regulator
MSTISRRARGRRTALVDEVGTQLSKLLAAARATRTQAAGRFHPELPPAAFHVATWLLAFGPCRTSDIALGVAMDRSAVSRLIDGLRTSGLVRVQADPSDRRAHLVGLAPAGHRHVTRALQWKDDVFHNRLAAWSEADLEDLAHLLAKLNS